MQKFVAAVRSKSYKQKFAAEGNRGILKNAKFKGSYHFFALIKKATSQIQLTNLSLKSFWPHT
jgi:hypothetical protein